jgi:glycerophosphoryl diester phosphodiesterase
VIIFGHRGAPGYPRRAENTAASFRKALQYGASGIEFDVRRCGDGRLVVIHDETVDRTTNGRGRVANLSYSELEKLDAGCGERIPLLTDVLDKFGPQCLLNIELKDGGIAEDVKRLVVERKLERRIIVSAFQWDELRPLAPEIPIGLLSSRLKGLVVAARELGAVAIHPRWDSVTERLVKTAHDADLQIHIWTVNDPAKISSLQTMGVDGVFTDCPERMSMIVGPVIKQGL